MEYLNQNADKFSEWSTVCIVKATGRMGLAIGEPFNYDSTSSSGQEANETETMIVYQDTLAFGGRLINDEDPSEVLKSYDIKLYERDQDIEDKYYLIEDTGEIFSNKYQDINEFYYFFKRTFDDQRYYKIVFDY